MREIHGWSEQEIDRRSFNLAALIRKVWRTISRKLIPRTTGSFAVSALGDLPTMWNEQVDGTIIPQLGVALFDGADEILRGMNSQPQWEPFEDFVESYLQAASNRLVNVGDEVWQAVQQQLLAGYGLSEDYEDLAARVQHVTGVSDARALMIARTEMHAALEAGMLQQALLLGAEGTKKWLATEDERTRPTHRDADGQSVDLNGTFTVGMSQLQFPGDPNGAPGETINCRCSLIFELKDDETVPSSLDFEFAAATDPEFEAKHPRGHGGKFAPKGASITEAVTTSVRRSGVPWGRALTSRKALGSVPVWADSEGKRGHVRLRRRAGSDPAWSPERSREIDESVLLYRGSAYKPINRYLRGQIDEQEVDRLREALSISPSVHQMVDDIDTAMISSSLPEDVVMWRGSATGQGVFDGSLGGDLTDFEWKEDGFGSTSADKDAAHEGFGDGGVLMRIFVPRGTHGIQLSDFKDHAGHDDEAELLLERGLHYRVVRDRGVDSNGTRMLDVEVVR